MALKPELESWLKAVGPKLSEDARKVLNAEFEKNEDAANLFRETVMARSDYSRAHDELKKEHERLKEEADLKTREANALLSANQTWKVDNEKVFNEAIKAKELADAELASHRARIKALAEQGLIDPNDPTYVAAAAAPKNGAPQGQFLTQEALDALLAKKEAQMGSQFADAFTFFEDLADEHFNLTGQRLKRQELLTELKKDSSKSLQQVWETKYNIPQIRIDLATKAEQERTNKAIAEAIAKDRSERATDAHSFRPRDLESDGENQHILSLFKDQTNAGATQGSEAVRAARASWERGEFRQQQPSKAS